MKINRNKLEIAMARACMNTADVLKAAEMPRPTFGNILAGRGVKPATAGKLAKALGVDVTDLIEE